MTTTKFAAYCVLSLAAVLPLKAESQVRERGFHHAINEHVRVVEKDGRQQSITNRYTTLATGMHRLVDGELVAADPVIELHRDGAVAEKTQHRVKFLANINNWDGAIDLQTVDDKRFLSRPLGISYYDRASGKSVLIAELKDSVGMLFPPNKIVYQDAFTDLQADLEYNNLLEGLQQNLIFRECPPQPAEFGLNNETTFIEMLTEFMDAPEPVKKTELRNEIDDDRQLDFGSMNIGVGKSFVIGEENRSYAVQKQWIQLDGRTFLIEQVPYSRIALMLNTLPESIQANNVAPGRIRHNASSKRLLPERQVANIKVTPDIQVASLPFNQKGFVIDYSLVTGSLTNFVFQGDTTYFITNSVFLYGTTVFEGGTVLKYKGGALSVDGGVSCQTDAYRPAVFTSWEDDSVGEWIPGSSGIPTSGASCPLVLWSNTELKHLRISYATQAMEVNATTTISDSQFVKCGWGVMSLGADIWLRNVLFYQCQTALGVLQGTIHGEHLTVNQSSNLAYNEFELKVRLTNTLLVAVADLGITDINATNSNFLWFTNDPGIYQTVGAGSHYLAEASPYRNAGTTNLSEEMLLILPKRTTYPPIVITSNITASITLSPVVERDTNVPDLGYHYPVLDYVIGNARVNGATVTVTNGAAVGFYCTTEPFGACTLECGAQLISIGTPSNPNRLVWYNTVQEQANANWTGGWGMLDTFAYDNYTCSSVSVNCSFTEFSRMADGFSHVGVGDIGWEGTLQFRDCLFSSGGVRLNTPGGTIGLGSLSVAVTNCLFLRSPLLCYSDGESFELNAVNNLFYGGNVSLTAYSASGTEFADFSFKDNFFFTNTISSNGVMTLTHSHNAYITNYNRLGPIATGDVTLTSVPSFEKGSLGDFYLPTNSLLINAGSQNATNAGLYHYTTTTNNVKETNSIVDIGFHYVATDGNGVPIDTDGDGLPDYFEDKNGDGFRQSTETDWEDPDTDGDGVSDFIEWLQGRDPLVNGSSSDSLHQNQLRVFTPLK